MDGVYSAKPAKVAEEIKELAENFDLIAQRRDTLRRKVKEAKIETNKHEIKRNKVDKEGTGSGKRGGGKADSEK